MSSLLEIRPPLLSLAADGSRRTVPGPLCYYETTLFDDDGDCLEGNLQDGFSMCGGGEIVVMPALESFLDMSNEACAERAPALDLQSMYYM
jgi:hypothetical protein